MANPMCLTPIHAVTDVTSGEVICILLTITAVVLHTKARTSTAVFTMVVVEVNVAERWSA